MEASNSGSAARGEASLTFDRMECRLRVETVKETQCHCHGSKHGPALSSTY